MSNKLSGRPKGATNILSGTARENIAAVFVRLGGTAAMAEWAKENPTDFYKIYVRLLPQEITGADGKDLIPETVSDIELAKRIAFVLTQAKAN